MPAGPSPSGRGSADQAYRTSHMHRDTVLEKLLEFLPERLLRSRLALVHECPDGLTKLVERHHANRGFAFGGLVAVDPVGDTPLFVRLHGEKLFARDLVHLLAFRLRMHWCRSHEAAEHQARCC